MMLGTIKEVDMERGCGLIAVTNAQSPVWGIRHAPEVQFQHRSMERDVVLDQSLLGQRVAFSNEYGQCGQRAILIRLIDEAQLVPSGL